VVVYDFVAAAIVVVFLVRGARRGLVREAVEVSVLIVGVVVAFRVSPVVGSIISGMANIPYETARIIAGIVMFFVLVVGGAVVARAISGAMKIVPGASVLNRFGGAATGATYAFVVIVLATTLGSVVPMSDGLRATVDDSIQSSAVGAWVRSSGGPVQQTLSSVGGEDVFATIIAIQDAVGSRLAVGTLPIPLPDVGDAVLAPSQVAAQGVFDSINRDRVAANLDPFGWSTDLAIVAVARSGDVYRSGLLALDDNLESSLKAQGVPGTINTELVMLAASREGVAEALIGTSEYRDSILDSKYRKAGVGIIDGPFGLLAVVVLSS